MRMMCCVYHNCDLDGWMSAAIVMKWHRENQKDTMIEFIGFNYGQEIPDLSGYEKVFMVDISFPKIVMEELSDRLGENFIWCDHHISAILDMGFTNNSEVKPLRYVPGARETTFAACELTWKYFFPNEAMPEIVRLLGRYDCFGHKGTDEEQKVLEFQYGARQFISNIEQAYEYLTQSIKNANTELEDYIWEDGQSIYGYLCTEAKQSYKNGFEVIFAEDMPGKYPSYEHRKFICINKERFNPINFGIDYHADGYDGAACFHYANGKWNFSLYNDNGKVDCSIICKQFSGGGHKGASGFTTQNINQFINQ